MCPVDFQAAGWPMKFTRGSREGDLTSRHGDCADRAIDHSVPAQVFASFHFRSVQQRGIDKRRYHHRYYHRCVKSILSVR